MFKRANTPPPGCLLSTHNLRHLQMLADDFATATPQERFMLMIAERVGSLETTIGKMAIMLNDRVSCLMTESLRSHISIPKSIVVDTTILDKIVAAVQKLKFVVVKHAWVIVHPVSVYDINTSISVYLKLKESVIAEQVSPSMNEHLADDLGITGSHVQPWAATYVYGKPSQRLQMRCDREARGVRKDDLRTHLLRFILSAICDSCRSDESKRVLRRALGTQLSSKPSKTLY